MLSKSQRITKEKKVYKWIAACLKSLTIIIKSCMRETNVGTTPIHESWVYFWINSQTLKAVFRTGCTDIIPTNGTFYNII